MELKLALIQTSGAVLRYWRTPGEPAVLLIQGVGVIGEGWRPQIEALARRRGLIWFDNRGIGESTLSGPLTIEAMAEDALAILDAEGIDQCHVVGHSMGGVIAQALALSAPRRVTSLSLLCTFHRGRDATRLSASMVWMGLRTRVGSRSMRRKAFLELILPARYLEQMDRAELDRRLSVLFGHDLADQPSITMRQLGAMSRYDATARLPGLASIPTLVVSAAQDRIAAPWSGRALAAAIPGSRYVEIPEAGHAVPIQRAREINEILEDHFTTAEQSRSGAGRA